MNVEVENVEEEEEMMMMLHYSYLVTIVCY
jgi:hypothetical protein